MSSLLSNEVVYGNKGLELNVSATFPFTKFPLNFSEEEKEVEDQRSDDEVVFIQQAKKDMFDFSDTSSSNSNSLTSSANSSATTSPNRSRSVSENTSLVSTIFNFAKIVESCRSPKPCAVCMSMIKPSSNSHEIVDEEGEEKENEESVNADNNMKIYSLRCGCNIHVDCLNGYLRSQIGDRGQMNLSGMSCPYGKTCAHYSTSESDLKADEQDIDDVNSSNNSSSSPYFISVADLRAISAFDANEDGDYPPLSEDEISRFESWVDEQKQGPSCVSSNDADFDPYVLGSTKACPTCQFRSTHYQGHQCHHISPSTGRNSRGGCPNCHKSYCYKCLSSSKENIRERGQKEACRCDRNFWSTFCEEFRTVSSVKKFMSYKHGVPVDSRCGCSICPDCKFGKPCGLCDGSCSVCKGFLNPGPSAVGEDTPKWEPYGPVLRKKMSNVTKKDFFAACVDGNMDVIRSANSKGLYSLAEATDEEGKFALFLACENGNVEAAMAVVNMSPKMVCERNSYGESSLFTAVENGHVDVVNFMLSQIKFYNNEFHMEIDLKKELMLKDNDGNCLFDIAVGHENKELLDVLRPALADSLIGDDDCEEIARKYSL